MKSVSVLALFVTLFVASCMGDDKYSTKYDNFDVDSVLKNSRLIRTYVNCLKGTGTCTPEGAELKRILPDALETGCSKCNEKQKTNSKKVIRFLIHEKPEYWNELETIYDPSGKYKTKYQKEFQEVAH